MSMIKHTALFFATCSCVRFIFTNQIAPHWRQQREREMEKNMISNKMSSGVFVLRNVYISVMHSHCFLIIFFFNELTGNDTAKSHVYDDIKLY